MASGPLDPRAWTRDRYLWGAIGVALVLRVVPLILWPQLECLRDECIYRSMAESILAGEGLTTSNKGWLPSPGYPYLLALMKTAFGSIHVVKAVQVLLSLASVGLLYGIAHEASDRKTARIAAWLFALNPTIA